MRCPVCKSLTSNKKMPHHCRKCGAFLRNMTGQYRQESKTFLISKLKVVDNKIKNLNEEKEYLISEINKLQKVGVFDIDDLRELC